MIQVIHSKALRIKLKNIFNMKQSFLDSLKGLNAGIATTMVNSAGFRPFPVLMGHAVSAIARYKTVYLWLDEKKNVDHATSDDAIEKE